MQEDNGSIKDLAGKLIYKEVNKMMTMIKCPYCGVYNIPTITIRQELDNEYEWVWRDELVIICSFCKTELTSEDLEGDE